MFLNPRKESLMDRSSSAETTSIEEGSRSRLTLPQLSHLPLTLPNPALSAAMIPRGTFLQNLGLLSDPALTSAITASILQQNAVNHLQHPFYGFPGRGSYCERMIAIVDHHICFSSTLEPTLAQNTKERWTSSFHHRTNKQFRRTIRK